MQIQLVSIVSYVFANNRASYQSSANTWYVRDSTIGFARLWHTHITINR